MTDDVLQICDAQSAVELFQLFKICMLLSLKRIDLYYLWHLSFQKTYMLMYGVCFLNTIQHTVS